MACFLDRIIRAGSKSAALEASLFCCRIESDPSLWTEAAWLLAALTLRDGTCSTEPHISLGCGMAEHRCVLRSHTLSGSRCVF